MAQDETQQHTRTLNIDENIVANIDNGIIVLDANLEIYHFNKWLELHTGLKESDVKGQNICHLFDNINVKTLTRKIKTALRIKTPTFYTANTSKYFIPIKINQLKNANFEYMQQDISIIPFNQGQGLVALIVTDQTIMANTNALLHTKIEKIKELNAALLKERETINRRILFFKFNKKREITQISQALLKLLQYSEEDLMDKDFFECENFLFEEEIQSQIQRAITELQVLKFEESCLSSAKQEFYFKSTLVPEFDSYGNHSGFILFREDISDSKNLALSHEKLLASSRSAAMGEMISMIAHQWRQPLSLINTVMATMKIKRELNILDEETLSNSFEKINNTTQYLSDTIDDFRDYFKPNKLTAEFDLFSIFDKSIYFLRDEMAQHNINYTVNIPDDVSIVSYKNELIQSIINIVKNSIDAFVNNKSDEKSITVSVQKLSATLILTIEDNAGGIQKDILNKIFDPYFSTKSKNGTGLGLYMCQKIITENLQGDIIIVSKESTTKVIIELPHSI